MKLHPTWDYVVIKPDEKPETEIRESGIITIKDKSKLEKPSTGIVVAVGPGKTESGVHIPVAVKIGAYVAFHKYSGANFQTPDPENEVFIILRESEILAVLE